MSTVEEDAVQDAMNTLELAIRTQVERDNKETDVRVSTQKSRFYKFRCWVVYGHLAGEKNICLRCGKKLNTPSVTLPKAKEK
jgi:ribosomal protein S27E